MPGHQRIALLFLSLLICTSGQLIAQDDVDTSPQPAETTSAEQQQLTERDNLWEQARSLAKEGEIREAIDAGEHVLSLNRKVHGESSREVAVILKWLTNQYFSISDTAKAREKAEELVKVNELLNGKEHHETISARWRMDYYDRMATVDPREREEMRRFEADYAKFFSGAEFEEAMAVTQKLIPLKEKFLGKEHPYLANTLVELGNAAIKAERYSRVEVAAGRALTIYQTHFGDNHPATVIPASQLFASLYSQDKFDRALETIEVTRSLYRTLGKEVDVARAESARGRCLVELNRKNEAKAAFHTALQKFRNIGDPRGEADQLKSLATIDDSINLKDECYRLWQEARKARSENKLSDAAKHGERALALERAWLGDKHSTIDKSLIWMADICEALDRWLEAEAYRRQILQRKTTSVGAHHWQAADARLALAHVQTMKRLSPKEQEEVRETTISEEKIGRLFAAGNYRDSIEVATQMLRIRKRLLGSANPKYIDALAVLGSLHAFAGSHKMSASYFEQASNTAKRVLGENHPRYIRDLGALGAVYLQMADYTKAEPLCRKVVEARRADPSYSNYDRLQSLRPLALIYSRTGFYSECVPLLEEALEIERQIHGEAHLDYAGILERLAIVHRRMGNYARALTFLRQALSIHEKASKASGKPSPRYTAVLQNLGTVYLAVGDHARAQDACEEAIEVVKQVKGKDHPDYASVLVVLGTVHEVINGYSSAEQCYLRAASIVRNTEGEKRAVYSVCLNNLANIYADMGEYSKSKSMYEKALDITKGIHGEESVQYAVGIDNIASLCVGTGNYRLAREKYDIAIDLYQKVLGVDHPTYAGGLSNLGALHFLQNEYEEAEMCFKDALLVTLQSLEANLHGLSERQQVESIQQLRHRLDAYISLAIQAARFEGAASRAVLRWKGRALVQQRAARMAANDAAIGEKFRELQLVTRNLSSLSRSSAGSDIQGWRDRVSNLTSRREELETELSRDSEAFRAARKRVSFEDIQGAIPKDGVLVDYLQFRRSRPSEKRKGRWDYETSLLATVVRHDGEPLLVDLGSSAPVDTAVEMWRSSLGTSEDSKKAGQLIRQKIWEPLLKHIGETQTVLVSTDGTLGRLPLGALPGKEPGTYLLEDHRLAMIPVPQLLPALLRETGSNELSRKLLLMGGVDYDAEPDDTASKQNRRQLTPRSDETFAHLPGTADEIASIAKTYRDIFEFDADDISTLEDAGATESRFRELAPQFYHLHLATHGFFASPDKLSALSSEAIEKASLRSSAGRAMLATRDHAVVGLNPGLLSGLAFAGANREPQADQNDGIMTAQEIAFLPLNGVDTVVLSACETGLGPVAGGEGLLGVQRAFQVAGARTTVASFWKVDDVVTRRLMERFYRNLFEHEMSRLDALREAQLWLLNNPEQVRGASRSRGAKRSVVEDKRSRVSPYYWAAFTLSGDWR